MKQCQCVERPDTLQRVKDVLKEFFPDAYQHLKSNGDFDPPKHDFSHGPNGWPQGTRSEDRT